MNCLNTMDSIMPLQVWGVAIGLILGMLIWWLFLYIVNRPAKETFSYADFERERFDNPLIKQLHIDQAKRDRTRHEMNEVLRITQYCNNVIMRHSNDIPDEDYKFFMLFEGMTAFLPISIKEFLGPFEGMIMIYNPFRDAKIINV